jgi:4a-hydroxytetrahydrobiopterin dehydratase
MSAPTLPFGWKPHPAGGMQKTFLFPDFQTALEFINRVAAAAEQEGRYPELHLGWGRVDVGGLSLSDSGLAARVDDLFFRR